MESTVRFVKNKKGQASIEFIMLILISLVYIVGYIQPNVSVAAESAKDISRVGQVRLATEKIVSSADAMLSSPGESKETINIFIPESSSITCHPAKLVFRAELSPMLNGKAPSACDVVSNQCEGEIFFIRPINCGNISSLSGPLHQSLVVQKNSSGNVLINAAT